MTAAGRRTPLADPARTHGPLDGATSGERWSSLLSGLTLLGLLGLHFVVSGILPSTSFPTPFDPEPEVRRFFVENHSEIRALSAVDVVTALVLLGFVASVTTWLRRLAPARLGLTVLAFGAGVTASAFTTVAALGLWVLSRSAATDDPALIGALHGLVYQAGGPALVLATGAFMGAASIVVLRTPVVPRWVPNVGIAGAVVSAAAVPAMYWEPVTWVLPASRFFLGAWVLGVCLALGRQLLAGRLPAMARRAPRRP